MPTVRKKIKVEFDADILMESLLHLYSGIRFLKTYSDADTSALEYLDEELTNALTAQCSKSEVDALTQFNSQ